MKLTKEEFLDKYGEVTVRLSYYYKYVFTFTGITSSFYIRCRIGGNAEDIYEVDINPENEYKLNELNFFHAIITTNDENLTHIAECDTR